MPEPRIWRSRHFEAGTKTLRARVVDRDGTVQTQVNFSGSVQVRGYDLGSATPSTAIYSNVALTVAGTIFNSLQTWDLDSTGFNFQTTITSNQIAWEGGHTYRVSCLLPHTSEGFLPVVFELQIEQLFSA